MTALSDIDVIKAFVADLDARTRRFNLLIKDLDSRVKKLEAKIE